MSLKKVKAIIELSRSKGQKELQVFLDMVNHYEKFLAPLNRLLQKAEK